LAPNRYLITGATGFLGGHLAEACVAQGSLVCTVAREGSDTAFLERSGVVVHRGDLTNPDTVRTAMADVDVVIHCAAKVGDWGPVESYRSVNVDGLRCLLELCRGKPLHRFVHISTLGVYAARHHYGTDETEPLPDHHIDGYTQTKVEAERLALSYQRDSQVPVVVLRPGFIYGPRDRTVLPKLIETLRQRMLRYLGFSSRAMNTIYVGNLVDAVFLAIDKPQAVGNVYNLTDGEFVSKRRFIESITTALNLPRPGAVPVPLFVARIVARTTEWMAKKTGSSAPRLTQAGLKFLGLNLDFSIERARRELGYQPRVPFAQAMEQTMEWYKEKV
jgi:2-alkyl-3-oxoalkanoate reductase